jgi:uncharacterized protein YidB (DUF937 family)
MGLLDVLNGMRNGPGGAPQSPAPSGGGMPTWMMALLGLLAYKAVKSGGLGDMLGGGPRRAGVDDRSVTPPAQGGGGIMDILGGLLGGARPGAAPANQTGGLGDLLGGALGGRGTQSGLGGLLGGLLAGGATGSLLNGGLRNLVTDMERNGQGDTVQSWIGTGENQSLAPNELARAAGLDDIEAVSQQTGIPREQMISELSQHLPEFVNQLTPDGRLPTDDEASRWV